MIPKRWKSWNGAETITTHFTALMSDWDTQLEKNGVARINSVFSKEEVDELRCLSWKAFRISKADQIQWKGHFPTLLFWPAGLGKFIKDERLANIASAILGDDILQLNSQVYFRLPGDGDEFAWHQDISFRTPKENFAKIETGYLQTAIVIDRMTLDNSPIEFVHGSHKKGDLNLIPRDNSEKGLRNFNQSGFIGTPMTAEPGDVLVWSVMVVHGSRKNKSNFARQYFMNGFAKTSCLKIRNGAIYMENGKLT